MSVVEFKRPEKQSQPLLEERRVTGPVRCFGCRHEWQACFPPGIVEFECPRCGTMKGRSKFEVLPEDALVYTCKCGNDLFVITPRGGPLCPNCGVYHRPYDDPKGAA